MEQKKQRRAAALAPMTPQMMEQRMQQTIGLAPLSPMQLKRVWKYRPTRAVLLGTTDQGSVLYRLPKSDQWRAEHHTALRGGVQSGRGTSLNVCGLIRDNVCAGRQG